MAKKRIISIILATVIAVTSMASLSACSKSDDKSDTSQSEISEAKISDAAKKAAEKVIPGKTTIRELPEEFNEKDGLEEKKLDCYAVKPITYTDDEGNYDTFYAKFDKSDKKYGDYIIKSFEPEGDYFDFGGTKIRYGTTLNEMVEAGLDIFDGTSELTGEPDWEHANPDWGPVSMFFINKDGIFYQFMVTAEIETKTWGDAEFQGIDFAIYRD